MIFPVCTYGSSISAALSENNNVVSNAVDKGKINARASLAPMLEKVLPAVVNISARGEMPLMRVPVVDQQMQRRNIEVTPKFEQLGSGVIVDAANGYILTNAHLVKDTKIVNVTLKDGRMVRAKVIGADDLSEVAVLQIEAKRLMQISLGDSSKLHVGDFVSAIGSPFGLQQTVTSGVVSGLDRNNLGIVDGCENFIQTDAPINPGNSGGALVNMYGELIGINTAIITTASTGGSIGVGFAIPSNMAKSVMDQLIKYGKVERGVIGILVQDVTPALADAMHLPSVNGALISQVIPGTPAAMSGFKTKDVIVEIMGKTIRSATQVRNEISLLRVGTEISLKIWRDNKFVTLTVVSTDPEKIKTAKQGITKSLLSGLELIDFNELVDNEQIKGVRVAYVEDASIAYGCGLHDGDIIIAAAEQPVNTISELQAIAAKHPAQLLLEVRRGKNGKIFLVLE